MNQYSPNDEAFIRAELADERASVPTRASAPSIQAVSVEDDQWYVRRLDGVTFGPLTWRDLTASVHAHIYSGDELVQGDQHPRCRLRELFPKYFCMPTVTSTEIRPRGSPMEQFGRNPLKYMIFGQDMPPFQTTDPYGKYRKLRLAIVATLGSLWALAMFALLIAAAISGFWEAAIIYGPVASFPFALGYFTFAGGLLEWEIVLSSRKAKAWRYWFGDHVARWICLVMGSVFMLAGGGIYAFTMFVLIAAILGF